MHNWTQAFAAGLLAAGATSDRRPAPKKKAKGKYTYGESMAKHMKCCPRATYAEQLRTSRNAAAIRMEIRRRANAAVMTHAMDSITHRPT